MFQFGGAWSFIWGAKPTNFPRGDGTAAGYTHDYSQSIWNSLKSWHICPKLSSDILICDCGSLWQINGIFSAASNCGGWWNLCGGDLKRMNVQTGNEKNCLTLISVFEKSYWKITCVWTWNCEFFLHFLPSLWKSWPPLAYPWPPT